MPIFEEENKTLSIENAHLMPYLTIFSSRIDIIPSYLSFVCEPVILRLFNFAYPHPMKLCFKSVNIIKGYPKIFCVKYNIYSHIKINREKDLKDMKRWIIILKIIKDRNI